ncbi:MAG: hypothetical protein OXI16_03375 [Chloroflexota bacterium]|nr:hypothetical protein [Chloroflexota bacterium]
MVNGHRRQAKVAGDWQQMSNLTSARVRHTDYEDAQEYYMSEGIGDGLPVVPPTEAKVHAMLDYVGMQPSDVIAEEGVRGVNFTAEKVAINAVMAGCKPEYMPVVVAAVQAVSEEPFNFHANSTSTNGVGVLVIVSGDIAKRIGINSGTVAMGHGFRANATIGRAMGLVKINAYGSVPHGMDKSTFGHPGKYSFCFAENDDVIPWEPLRVEKGYADSDSTVTVFAANSPVQVNTQDESAPEDFLSIAADASIVLGERHSEFVLALSPELMNYIRSAGWSKQRIKDFVLERGTRTGRELNEKHRRITLYTGDDLDKRIPVVSSTDEITVVGAGGDAGPFAMLIGAWGDVISITKKIQT